MKTNFFDKEWEEGECETCWDAAEIKRKGIYRKEYDMTMCGKCLQNAKDFEDEVRGVNK